MADRAHFDFKSVLGTPYLAATLIAGFQLADHMHRCKVIGAVSIVLVGLASYLFYLSATTNRECSNLWIWSACQGAIDLTCCRFPFAQSIGFLFSSSLFPLSSGIAWIFLDAVLWLFIVVRWADLIITHPVLNLRNNLPPAPPTWSDSNSLPPSSDCVFILVWDVFLRFIIVCVCVCVCVCTYIFIGLFFCCTTSQTNHLHYFCSCSLFFFQRKGRLPPRRLRPNVLWRHACLPCGTMACPITCWCRFCFSWSR